MRLKFICLLAFLIALSALAQPGTAQQGSTPQSQADLRQQIHSQQVHGSVPGQITQELARTSGDVNLRTTQSPPLVVHVLDPLEELVTLSCEHDVIVLGTINSGVSHPTVDQGYIYTDWNLSVEDILKNNPKSPIQAGQTIVVTRPGGTLLINGRHVNAVDNDFRQFQSSNEVLLYLRYLPDTGTYSLGWPTGFIFADSKIINLDRAGYNQTGTTDKNGLLALARKALTQPCAGGKK